MALKADHIHHLHLGHNHHVVEEAKEAFETLRKETLLPRAALLKFLMAHNMTDEEGGRIANPSHPEEAKEAHSRPPDLPRLRCSLFPNPEEATASCFVAPHAPPPPPRPTTAPPTTVRL